MITLPMLLLTLGGVVIAVIVGSLWYAPSSPMGKIHMQYIGFDKLSPEEQQRQMAAAKPQMPKLYGAQMLLSLLTSFAVVTIVTFSMQNGLPFSMAAAFVVFNWLCFMMPVVGGSILWSNVERRLAWKKFFSDALSHLVTVLLIALLASFFA